MDLFTEIISARDARKIAEAEKEKIDQELEFLDKKIKEVASLGQYQLEIEDAISPAARVILEQRGYKISEIPDYFDGSTTIIKF